uniref:Secreted protein n=1 Tax=Oryza barthii TaxID=65489 RepID=A0A0D3HJZ8_9ORYZ
MEGAVLVLHQVAILALPAAEGEGGFAYGVSSISISKGRAVVRRYTHGACGPGEEGIARLQYHRDEQQLTRSYGSLSGSLRRQIPICMLAEWQ